jgi:hypothetical protein
MIEYCYNNHIKYGYDGIFDYNFRDDPNQKYSLKFTKAEQSVLDYKNESIRTANLIKEKSNNETIWISYSGGIDSECIIKSFLEAKIDFKLAMNRFKNDMNEYDLFYARKFCQEHDLKLYEFEIDVEKFLENDLEEYAFELNCNSPIFPTHLFLWDKLDGFIVGGHGDPIFRRIENTNNWYFQVKENEDVVYRYLKWRNRNGAPSFYSYTPEMILSFMYTGEFSRLVTFGHRGKVAGSTGTKELILQKNFGVEKRTCATGFENIKFLDSKYRTYLESKITTTVWTQELQAFIKDLWPDQMTGSAAGTPHLVNITL